MSGTAAFFLLLVVICAVVWVGMGVIDRIDDRIKRLEGPAVKARLRYKRDADGRRCGLEYPE